MVQRYLSGLLLLVICPVVLKAQSLSRNIEIIENQGQWPGDFQYKASTGRAQMFLERDGFTYLLEAADNTARINDVKHGRTLGAVTLRYHAYKVKLEGASAATLVPSKIQQHYYNYFLGADSSRWKHHLYPALALDYKGIYPGTDLHLSSEGSNLKYEFQLQPGADPSAIVLRFDGADQLSIQNGNLVIGTSVGEVTELKPYAYQITAEGRREVSCRYNLSGNTLRYSFPRGYDETLPLVIDPTIVFATFTGSTSDNWGLSATYDPQGNFYAGGIVTNGGVYPTTPGAFQTTYNAPPNAPAINGPWDMAITKFNPTGTSLIYSTYLGGTSDDHPHSMIVDPAGNLIIAGRTFSNDFPVTASAYDNSYNGSGDMAVVKLNASGSALLGSTFVGGTGPDGINITLAWGVSSLKHNYGDEARSEVIIDKLGNVYVAASTQSTDFPVVNAAQPNKGAFQDGVVLKLSPTLSSLLWSTHLGGNQDDAAYVLALDTAQTNIYVAGGTASPNFPVTTGAIYNSYQGGSSDGFITRYRNGGSYPMLQSTYIGRGSYDQCYGVQVDLENRVYAMGQTLGGTFPVSAGVYSNPGSSQFIIKLDSLLSSNIYSTVFGSGNPNLNNISPVAFLVDTCQNVYISGWGGPLASQGTLPASTTTGMPVTPGAIQSTTDGHDFYFFVLAKNGSSQLYGSFLGHAQPDGNHGEHVDGGTSRFDKNGVIYQSICGACISPTNTFPTTPGVWATQKSGPNCNLVAVKIAFQLGGVIAEANANPNTKGCPPFTVNFQNSSANALSYDWDFGDNTAHSTQFTPQHTYTGVGTFYVRMIAYNPNACKERDTAYLTIIVDTNRVKAGFNAVVTDSCGPFRVSITNTSQYSYTPGAANYTTLRWFFGDNTTYTGTTPGTHNYPDTGTYTIMLVMRDSTACNSPDTVRKTVRIQNLFVRAKINMPDSICIGPGLVFANGSTNATYYLWNFGDGQNSTSASPSHTYAATGSYKVMLVAGNSKACNKADTVYKNIKIKARPTAAFTFTPTLPAMNTPTDFRNASLNAVSYLWIFGDGANSGEIHPSHLYKRTGTYKVCLVARSAEGCTDTACKTVSADIQTLLDVPNAFSPNGDGANDILFVRGGAIETLNFKIFNRWGQLVFESSSLEVGWDGTFNGKDAEMDAYGYVVTATFIDGSSTRKQGNVTLLR